ncbi:hypothetical protein [Streptomyces sp. ISL-11]|uniref:hypothetical protein n=1 Tax=Streptomyces sp. ISL-11 TaxID=2819174 RepID=UPI001BE66022|nr:hypothetical protein [Streptomyces sp. ISL-11]MBT2383267.1 hypothetical protein [Streptomyces sp. ISL-11]
MSTEGGTPDSTPDRTPDRQGRRRPRLAVVSVAAAVLLAGGGGAYWASTAASGKGGDSSEAGGDGSPPPLALDGVRQGGPSQGIAVGEPNPNGVRYRAAGELPKGPRSAPVLLPRDGVTRDEVASLAKALSVQGAPRLEQGVWRVGGAPGADEPTLQVNGKGPGNWSFARYGTPGGSGCTHGTGPAKGLGKDLGPDPAAAVDCPQLREGSGQGDPVSEEKAKNVAAPVLKVLGQSGARTRAGELFGAVRAVVADPVVNGTPTYGWQTRLEVGSDGQLVGGGGQLQAPVKGADYPLVNADEALTQLNKGRADTPPEVSVGGCASAVPHDGDGRDGTVPCPGKARASGPATVTGASYVLASHYVRGRQALVPSWLFQVRMAGSTEKDGTVQVVQPAVDPKFLAKPAGGTPGSAKPSGKPSGTPKTTRPHVESYTQDGRKLVLHFWGGVCNDYAATAEQSADVVRVSVTGTEKEPGRSCVLMAKRYDETVTLDEPLGDREVVDAATGEAVSEKQEK